MHVELASARPNNYNSMHANVIELKQMLHAEIANIKKGHPKARKDFIRAEVTSSKRWKCG